MPSVLRVYDRDGFEVGWFAAVEAETGDDWEYSWEMTHPEPEAWSDVRGTFSFHGEPGKVGRAETVEGGPDSPFKRFHTEHLVRLDDDGPEAYLRDVASSVERDSTVRTEITEE